MSSRYEPQPLVAAEEPAFGTFAPRGLQALALACARVPPFYRGFFRRPLANLVRGLGRSRTLDVVRDGLAFRLRGAANLIEDGILVHPAYNRVEIDFLSAGVPEGGAFVDLGANMGLYTLPLARRAGPRGRVLAVDANRDIVPALEFNLRSSGLANVTIACVAVGERAGRASLAIRHDDLAIVEVQEDAAGDIEIRPLVEIVRDAGLSRIDALKADIEGYEDQALAPFLRDAEPALHPRRIVIEHLGRPHWKTDLFPVFAEHGYEFVGQTRGNSLFAKRGG
jgi:FkbM family methyltransferase